MNLEDIAGYIHRYFVARYGKYYAFRAPEAFDNAIERWMLYVANGNNELAEEEIDLIENHYGKK